MGPFERHLEQMACFRRTHTRLVPVHPARPDSGSLDPLTVTALPNDEPENLFTDAHGRTIAFPIWDVTVPKGSQN
jgi:hypothetical protein